MVRWLIIGTIVLAAAGAHWFPTGGTTTIIKYRVRAQVEGEPGPTSDEYDERAETEKAVAAIEQAIAANRFGNL